MASFVLCPLYFGDFLETVETRRLKASSEKMAVISRKTRDLLWASHSVTPHLCTRWAWSGWVVDEECGYMKLSSLCKGVPGCPCLRVSSCPASGAGDLEHDESSLPFLPPASNMESTCLWVPHWWDINGIQKIPSTIKKWCCLPLWPRGAPQDTVSQLQSCRSRGWGFATCFGWYFSCSLVSWFWKQELNALVASQ